MSLKDIADLFLRVYLFLLEQNLPYLSSQFELTEKHFNIHMQDGARFFAYTTWAIMISLAIIIATHFFLDYISEPGWVGTAVLLAFGFVYMNITYVVIRRYIRKVPAPTNRHILLAVIIFLPPFIWTFASVEELSTTDVLIWVVLALGCGLGALYGNRAGIKARYEYIQALKEHQRKMEERQAAGKR